MPLTREILTTEFLSFALLISDMNLHCGLTVEGNHEKTTVRGKLLNDLLEDGDYDLELDLGSLLSLRSTVIAKSEPNPPRVAAP